MTAQAPGPLRLKEMTPPAARAAAAQTRKLILPVGTTEQHGPHLPLGGDTFVVERLADDLSTEFQVLRAPTIEFGVNDRIETLFSGGASVRRKTLRRWVNDLIPDWEQLGVQDIIVLTMNGYAPHQEALGTVVAEEARVRVIDILAIDFRLLVEHPDDPIHGGELDTSLLLFVRPELVRLDAAVDCILEEQDARRHRRGSALRMPPHSSGSVGHTTSASSEKGRRIYQFIYDRLRERVFQANTPPAEG